MRKMEVGDISQTLVPIFERVSDRTYERLKEACSSIEFLDLQAPVIRNVDIIWAEELFDGDGTEKLTEARRLLEYTANKRNA